MNKVLTYDTNGIHIIHTVVVTQSLTKETVLQVTNRTFTDNLLHFVS